MNINKMILSFFLFFFGMISPVRGYNIYITSVYNFTGKTITLLSGKNSVSIDHKVLCERLSFRVEDVFRDGKFNSISDNNSEIRIRLFTFEHEKRPKFCWVVNPLQCADELIKELFYTRPAYIDPSVLSSFNIHTENFSQKVQQAGEKICIEVKICKGTIEFSLDSHQRSVLSSQ